MNSPEEQQAVTKGERFNVIPARFMSPRPRQGDRGLYDSDAALAVNNEFEIRLHVPDVAFDKRTDVVIVIHGFGQESEKSFLDSTVGLCPRLAQRRFASVLLPLPFHLNRWPQGDEAYDLIGSPTMLAVRNKQRFYLGYWQMLKDIEGLVSRLDLGAIPAFANELPKHPRIHLVGHSMGGLAALTYQLYAQIAGKRVVDSLVLLASGCSMRTLSPLELGIVKRVWAPFRDFYLKEFEKGPLPGKVDPNSPEHKIFRQIFLGKQQDELEAALEELTENTLVVIGAEDEVNALRHVSSGLDNIPKYITLVVPKWGHLFEERLGKIPEVSTEETVGARPKARYRITPEWSEWSDFILDAVCRFMRWSS